MGSIGGETPGPQGQRLADPSIHHDLPVELLSHIISLSVQDYSANIMRTQTLCLVCSRWRDVVEGTPELWCRITSADPLRGVRKAIEYSRDHPLDINSGDIYRPSRCGPEEFLSAVSIDAWRWRRASITLRLGSEDLLQRWISGKAPRLEALIINYHGRIQTPVTLFEGAPLPCLRTLQVNSVPLVWDGQQLFNLQKLNIIADKHVTPPLSSVLSVLRATQRLEDFTFSFCGSPFQTPGDYSATVRQQSILLPALKKLRIEASAILAWLALVRAIRAPVCQLVSLGGSAGDLENADGLAQICEGISQFLPRLRTRAEWEERVHITIEPWKVAFRSSTIYLDFGVTTGKMQLAKWMVLNLVDELGGIALYIGGQTWNAAELEMFDPPILRRPVSRLNIGPSIQPRAILQHLSSPNPGLDGQNLWPLPNLTELSLSVTADDLAVIIHMLRCRAQAIDLPGSVRPQTMIELLLNTHFIGSVDCTEAMSEIDSFMRGNGGSLKIVTWGS